jgi:hypothetical protein
LFERQQDELSVAFAHSRIAVGQHVMSTADAGSDGSATQFAAEDQPMASAKIKPTSLAQDNRTFPF